jgi:hypothetical protein
MKGPYALETDKDLEAGRGVVLDYPKYEFSITIHRAGGANAKFQRVASAKLAPHRRKIEAGVMDEAEANAIWADIYSEAVIVGWDGVVDRDGKPLPFNKKNCVQVLTDVPHILKDVMKCAEDVEMFKAAQEEAEEKNS